MQLFSRCCLAVAERGRDKIERAWNHMRSLEAWSGVGSVIKRSYCRIILDGRAEQAILYVVMGYML